MHCVTGVVSRARISVANMGFVGPAPSSSMVHPCDRAWSWPCKRKAPQCARSRVSRIRPNHFIRCRRPSGPTTGSSAASAHRGSSCWPRHCSRKRPMRPRRRFERSCHRTCAVAPVTPRSSTQYGAHSRPCPGATARTRGRTCDRGTGPTARGPGAASWCRSVRRRPAPTGHVAHASDPSSGCCRPTGRRRRLRCAAATRRHCRVDVEGHRRCAGHRLPADTQRRAVAVPATGAGAHRRALRRRTRGCGVRRRPVPRRGRGRGDHRRHRPGPGSPRPRGRAGPLGGRSGRHLGGRLGSGRRGPGLAGDHLRRGVRRRRQCVRHRATRTCRRVDRRERRTAHRCPDGVPRSTGVLR